MRRSKQAAEIAQLNERIERLRYSLGWAIERLHGSNTGLALVHLRAALSDDYRAELGSQVPTREETSLS